MCVGIYLPHTSFKLKYIMEALYKEVFVNNHFDRIIEAYQIYGDGDIIGVISSNGYVDYNSKEAKECPYVQKVVQNFIEKHKLREKKKDYYIDY